MALNYPISCILFPHRLLLSAAQFSSYYNSYEYYLQLTKILFIDSNEVYDWLKMRRNSTFPQNKGGEHVNTIERIRELLTERGWSEYRLVKESGLSQSTISNIFHRNSIPSIPTLEAICRAFGITLSEFFAEGEFVFLSPDQMELFHLLDHPDHEIFLFSGKGRPAF